MPRHLRQHITSLRSLYRGRLHFRRAKTFCVDIDTNVFIQICTCKDTGLGTIQPRTIHQPNHTRPAYNAWPTNLSDTVVQPYRTIITWSRTPSEGTVSRAFPYDVIRSGPFVHQRVKTPQYYDVWSSCLQSGIVCRTEYLKYDMISLVLLGVGTPPMETMNATPDTCLW